MYGLLFLLAGCQTHQPSHLPVHFLAITHSALNRITFFDLERREVVGVLPTQKLPHDMLLSHSVILFELQEALLFTDVPS